MKFLNDLLLEATPKGYRLARPLVAIYRDGVYVVPKGFETDFASVPKFLRWFIDNDDVRVREAATLHDFLYRTHWVPRKTADKMFLEALKAKGCPLGKRLILWAAVRLFGWAYAG